MKSIKTMLMGIAFLIVGSCGVPFWVSGVGVGAVVFFVGIIVGLILCLKGFFAE